jgi:hypothetical protein
MRLEEEISSGNRPSHQTEEVMFMEHDSSQVQPGGRVVKTLAIRLDEDQHAQLSLIAQLEGLTITDAIRGAIDSWIQSKRSNPELQQRAEAVLVTIEQEAATRRNAIASLMSEPAPKAPRGGAGRGGGKTSIQTAPGSDGLVPGYL